MFQTTSSLCQTVWFEHTLDVFLLKSQRLGTGELRGERRTHRGRGRGGGFSHEACKACVSRQGLRSPPGSTPGRSTPFYPTESTRDLAVASQGWQASWGSPELRGEGEREGKQHPAWAAPERPSSPGPSGTPFVFHPIPTPSLLRIKSRGPESDEYISHTRNVSTQKGKKGGDVKSCLHCFLLRLLVTCLCSLLF